MASNAIELKNRQQWQHLEQEQLVGYWIRRFGITRDALESHPFIDDVILLIRIKQEFNSEWSHQDSGYWGYCWSWCYHHRHPLTKKHTNKIEKWVNNLLERRQNRQQRIQVLRQHRKNPYNKSADNIAAKDADADTTPPWVV